MKNKVIVITGASSGIGEATAKILSQQGATVVLGARREDRLKILTQSIIANGGTASYKVTDVSKIDEMQDLVSHAVDKYGKIDVIINNAGVMLLSFLEKLKVDEWQTMIDTNIKGVLYGIASALPVMYKQGFGHVINISSTAGHVVEPTSAVYAGTKFAVMAISEGLRKESEGKIKVTVISPGVTQTELGNDISDEFSSAMLKEIRKTSMSPNVIANAIAYTINQPDGVDVSEILVREIGRNKHL